MDPGILAARHLLDLARHPGRETVTSLSGQGQIYELQVAEDCELADRSFGELSDGKVLHIPALMVILSLPVCAFFGEYQGMITLGWTGAAAIALAQILYWPARGCVATQPRHAMLIAAIAWLAISGNGTLPFILGQGTPVLDAAFESLSGFTGTGMSVLTRSKLPHYLQWWRSLS